jgi:hypothetical protein
MHGPWHPILHNAPRLPKDRNAQTTSPQYVPVIANDYSWYRPLDPCRKEIRILFLEPEPLGSTKDVVVHVFNASLLESGIPKLYGCLSYCWGNPSITKAIQVVYTEKSKSGVDGLVTRQTEFQVTANLEAALRVFRSKLKRPVMWADALCIDQSDINERSSQVSLMAEIYRQAVQTIVWLGEADSTTKKVFDFAIALQDMADKPNKFDQGTKIAGLDYHRLRPLAKGEVQFTEEEISSDEFYAMRWGFQSLLARPFFRRAWVLQEVGLVDRLQVVVHCGEHSLWWQYLLNLTTFEWRAAANQGPLPIDLERDRSLGLPSDNLCMKPGAYHILPEIWTYLSKHCSNTSRGRVIDFIFRRLDIQATDPRDHIFALFSLMEECEDQQGLHPGLRADYSRTVCDAYTLFTRAVIEKVGNLVVLSAVDVFQKSDTQEQHKLPSWVPDYSNHINLRRTLGYLSYACYRASGRSKPRITYSDASTLTLSGFVVDEVSIETTWGPFHMKVKTDNVNNIEKPATLLVKGETNGIQSLWRMVSSGIKTNPITHQGPLEAFILTLICSRRAFVERPSAVITSVTDVKGLFADFAAYWILNSGDVSELPPETKFYSSHKELLHLTKKGHAGSFGQRLYYTCHQRSFLVTERGLLALVPPGTKNGDLIVVCEGATVPFVVRKTAPGVEKSMSDLKLEPVKIEEPMSDLKLEFVGECYVHGRMDGSAIVEFERGDIMRRGFHLV